MLGLGKKGNGASAGLKKGPDLEAVERLLPERGWWEGFVKRVLLCCGELELADGEGLVTERCVSAGCDAVGAFERSRLWERLMPAGRRQREGFEDCIKVGLFYAGCLRTLLPLLCSVKVKVGGSEWEPFESSLPDFLKTADGGDVEIEWVEKEVHAGRMLTLASLFLGRREIVEILRPVVAQEVFDCLRPGGERGLFGTILGDAGGVVETEERVDVAGVFLEGLRRVVMKGYLGVNQVPGEFFVAGGTCFLASPNGVNVVLSQMRKAGYDFEGKRKMVYEALAERGFLVGFEEGGRLTYKGVLRGSKWEGVLEIMGLPIATEALWPERVPEWMREGLVVLERKVEEESAHG